MERNGTLLRVQDLRKYFPVRGGLLHTVQAQVKAVDGVSFDVRRGEILGIVGESGCGKSTTARLLLRLIEPDAGEVYFEGGNILQVFTAGLKTYRRQVQMVFQDPYSSLNPRMNIEDAVAFNALVHGASRREARAKAWDVLHKVGLRAEQFGRRYPHELSGGQRQRVNIARALVLDPKLVLLDEPVSSLDKSVQAQVLNLLQTLKHDLGLTYVFISHDLHVIEYLSDRVLVMYLGQIVEVGSAEEVSAEPLHPYTQALWASAPSMNPEDRIQRPPLSGDPPNPINPPTGCRFRTRCPHAMETCAAASPPLLPVGTTGRQVACYLFSDGKGPSASPR
ncbi:MAG TPA: oligopeptide/dipeptide ABC transporter ATP-binding protein [Candidatus Tectomicrobia bacterium]|nr:oligopeptide/dipeptide ABC transporter ATP-binding protein [Candidatus Tectomicrobia bacterium]